MKLNELTISESAKGLKNKDFSSVELTQACLDRISERNEKINAFITVIPEIALERAKIADERIARGDAHVLTGIPYSAKDAICTAGIRSTGSAKILDNYVPAHEATVLKKINEAGAILIGKNNCDSFGHGASNENSMYGPVRNPHDETKVAGGSSGGSAAAVADHQAIFSIAEDTGGSIRQPAAFCGITGLRPSYGRNSRYGIMPMASSFDTVGPMAKSVEDVAILMEVMAGHDVKDATTVPDGVPIYTKELGRDLKGLKIGVPKEYLDPETIDSETVDAVRKQLSILEGAGCTLIDISLKYTRHATAVYYILVPSEDSSNLGRLDGIRYGVQSDSGSDLFSVYAESRAQGFPEEVKRRIMLGTYALSAGYYDAYYRKAQKVRTLIIRDFESAFNDVDVIIGAVSPFPAFSLGDKVNDPVAMYLADLLAIPAAVAGIPGLAVHAGMTKNGLPIGMQIIGPRMSESLLFNVGHQLSKLS